jgi:hypothetical protein
MERQWLDRQLQQPFHGVGLVHISLHDPHWPNAGHCGKGKKGWGSLRPHAVAGARYFGRPDGGNGDSGGGEREVHGGLAEDRQPPGPFVRLPTGLQFRGRHGLEDERTSHEEHASGVSAELFWHRQSPLSRTLAV